MGIQQQQRNPVKSFRFNLPVDVWTVLCARSQKHDRKPGAEILQILKAEFASELAGDTARTS